MNLYKLYVTINLKLKLLSRASRPRPPLPAYTKSSYSSVSSWPSTPRNRYFNYIQLNNSNRDGIFLICTPKSHLFIMRLLQNCLFFPIHPIVFARFADASSDLYARARAIKRFSLGGKKKKKKKPARE